MFCFFFFQTENALAAVPEESRSEGKINFKVYRKYFTAGANYFVIFILLVFNILAQVSCLERQLILNMFGVCLLFSFFFSFLTLCMLFYWEVSSKIFGSMVFFKKFVVYSIKFYISAWSSGTALRGLALILISTVLIPE